MLNNWDILLSKKNFSKKPDFLSKLSPLFTIEHLKRLEFLDLEYSSRINNRISTENFKFNCKFDKGFNHILHSENNHLNSLTDLILNLGFNLEKEKTNIYNNLVKLIHENSENIKNIVHNLEFIKDQNNNIINYLKGKSIEKTESFDFSKELDSLTKTIKNLKLDPIIHKIDITPPIYKHWTPRK